MSIFSEAEAAYGVKRCKEAMRVIDEYVDKVYPNRMGKPHPAMSRHHRMSFAMKLMACVDELEVEMNDVIHALNGLIDREADYKSEAGEEVRNPVIFYATSPKTMGYWLMTAAEIPFETLMHTIYQPVDTYY